MLPTSSEEFATLWARQVELDSRFLPAVAEPTGRYSPEQEDGIRAFMLLLHAEIEHYLESACQRVVDSTKAAWDGSAEVCVALLSIVAHAPKSVKQPPDRIVPGPSSIRQVVDSACSQFGTIVFGNNGVKEENIARLVVPVGIKQSDLATYWLAEMSSFGADRGNFAHKGSVAASVSVDPFDLKKLVARLFDGLWRLDLRLMALRSFR